MHRNVLYSRYHTEKLDIAWDPVFLNIVLGQLLSKPVMSGYGVRLKDEDSHKGSFRNASLGPPTDQTLVNAWPLSRNSPLIFSV